METEIASLTRANEDLKIEAERHKLRVESKLLKIVLTGVFRLIKAY